jgi:cytochrome c-type biogenesis protein CcsB
LPQAYYLAERLLLIGFVSYLGSIATYLANSVAARRRFLERLASWFALGGLVVHTSALAARWVANAQVEIYQQALAEGRALSTYEWLWAAARHPPYTNLYESLLFIAWALMVSYAVVQLRFRLRPLGIFAVTLAALVLAVAFLVSDKEISPLVPALQSYWILIHVGLLFVSYSLFALAACVALLFLFKIDVPTAQLGKWLAGASAAFTLLAAGRWDRIQELVLRGDFMMSPVVAVAGKTQAAFYFPPGGAKAVRWYLTLPGVGPWLLAAVGLFVAAAVLFHRERARDLPLRASWGARALAAAALALLGGLAAMAWSISAMQQIPASAAPGRLAYGAPFARMAMTANQYAPAVLALVALASAAFLVAASRRPSLVAGLPDEKRLDEMAYRVIIVGFPFLSFGIIMGAVWAHESWGRYWGWDPKETWALITWFVYAAYLHTRITLGWVGKPGALIAVAGFAVVVFTYMGVNLGLTGEGLHVYGAG